MLKKLGPNSRDNAEKRIADAEFPQPFASTLEYNAPARGPWNIVHTGMLVPGSHQIFACAEGCLRGVILTAAEMNAMNRMSWISVCENDLFNGELESNILEGTSDILRKLPVLPRCVLLFISCIQLFAGCDLETILDKLRKRFPHVDFIDCYMNPTMRKHGLTPDQLMRRQLYAALKAGGKQDSRSVNLLGNDRPTEESSELVRMIRDSGKILRDITHCRSYEDYQQMAESALSVTYLPTAAAGGDALAERLGRKHLPLAYAYSTEELLEQYRKLADALEIAMPDFHAEISASERALDTAQKQIGKAPVEIDYTATPRPLALARLLAEHGFHVSKVYADVFLETEKNDFQWLRTNFPDLRITSTVHPKMRFAGKGVPGNGEKVLAIGQKAAYFSGTHFFVNQVAGGGHYGFDGISRLAGQMIEAFQTPKDTERVIQYKGLGCESCL